MSGAVPRRVGRAWQAGICVGAGGHHLLGLSIPPSSLFINLVSSEKWFFTDAANDCTVLSVSPQTIRHQTLMLVGGSKTAKATILVLNDLQVLLVSTRSSPLQVYAHSHSCSQQLSFSQSCRLEQVLSSLPTIALTRGREVPATVFPGYRAWGRLLALREILLNLSPFPYILLFQSFII